MKTYLLPLFLLCCCSLTAQNSTQKKIEIGVTTGLDYILQEQQIISSSYKNLQNRPQIGLSVALPLAEKWYLKSGLSLRNHGNTYEISDLRWGSEFNPDTGEYTPDPSLPESLVAKTFSYYFHIPLHAQYRFVSTKRIRPYIEFGLSANPYLFTVSKNSYDGKPVEKNRESYGSFSPSLSVDLGGGLLWQLSPTSDKFQLMLAPMFRYQPRFRTSPSYSSIVTNPFTLNAALDIGLIMKLGK